MTTLSKPTLPKPAPAPVSRQLAIAFDSVQIRGTSAPERSKAIACLAGLLMQAAGVETEERDDDRH